MNFNNTFSKNSVFLTRNENNLYFYFWTIQKSEIANILV